MKHMTAFRISGCKKLRAQLVAVNRRLGRSVPMFFISVNLLHAALNHHQRANEDEQTFQRFELDERALVRHLRQEMSSYDGADYSQ